MPGPISVHDSLVDTTAQFAQGLRLDPGLLLAAGVVALVAGVLGLAARGFIQAALDELLRVGRDIGGWMTGSLLGRRKTMPTTPWFCGACLSHNGIAASRCYHCGARRSDAEAMAPDPDRAVQRAGLTRRR